MIGRTIAHYRVTEKLGEGGMGEVYRARDDRLNRDVALKVLPEAFAQDADRMARFSREARVLASLNHPNIAAIYGLEESDSTRCLVLELVEGETLAERISQGPVPLDEALKISRQMAEALEAAHDRGIIHRDLKPGNVKVTPEGTVKVLDFGLAKALEGEPAAVDVSKSPTLGQAASQVGILLGTAGYMSPEQAKGKPVDRRADIWAFGVVLVEMLTGKPLFEGETVSETLAAVMMREPDLNALPGDTPPPIRRLLHRCLQKDPRRRLQAIGEARIAIEDYLADPDAAAEAVVAPAAALRGGVKPAYFWAAVAALAAVVVAAAGLWLATRPSEKSPVRLKVEVSPEEELFTQLGAAAVLSPDGQRLAYVAGTGGERKLYVRTLDQLEATPLSGTEGARNPFFSPDGEWLGFFTDSALKKVSVYGGAPLKLADTEENRGATWSADDVIIYAPHTIKGLHRIPATGGAPEEVTTPDEESGSSHRFPHFLPGGRAVLYQARTGNESFDEGDIEVFNLETGERKILHRGGFYPRYLPTGHLTYVREGTLFAAPFDLDQLEITGPPAPLIEGVVADTDYGGAQYDFASDGTLVYLSGAPTSAPRTLVWVDQEGNASPLLEEPREYLIPRFSPGGDRLAFQLEQEKRGAGDIWIYDIQREVMTRFTFDEGDDFAATWSPDGKWIVFASARGRGGPNLYRKRSDGTGDVERLTESKNLQAPFSFSPDGKSLLFLEQDPETGLDILELPLEGERKPEIFLRTPFNEVYPAFSPDGRWVAYASNESGRLEIYVRPYPGPGGKWQISDGGATSGPRWSPDGRKLYYRAGDRMMVVSVSTGGQAFQAGKPRALFEKEFLQFGPFPSYDLAPDGKRFVMFRTASTKEGGEASRTHLHFVFNWFEEVRRLAPAGKN